MMLVITYVIIHNYTYIYIIIYIHLLILLYTCCHVAVHIKLFGSSNEMLWFCLNGKCSCPALGLLSPFPSVFTPAQALLAAARHPNQETFRRCVDAIAAVPEAPALLVGETFGVLRGNDIGRKLQLTLPKTNSSPLKNDGWKTILSFWGMAYFQGLQVKLQEGNIPPPFVGKGGMIPTLEDFFFEKWCLEKPVKIFVIH